MAKKQDKQDKNVEEDNLRQSRKEVLLARKQEQQLRQVRIAVIVVAALLGVVILIGLINEFFVSPNRTVATVNEATITLSDWQERVRAERAQRVVSLETQLENFGGDVGIVQQFMRQSILELQDGESLGEAVLDRMVEEELIFQEAAARGISVTEAEIDERIGSTFNYFGGESPTAAPEATETAVPTPSITPIPVDTEPEAEPTVALPTVEAQPTEPIPTPTPVSAESYQEQLGEFLAEFKANGMSETMYRSLIKTQLISDKLTDALAEEQELPSEAMQANLLVSVFGSREEADAVFDDIFSGDYLTVWNTIRSAVPDPEDENPSTAFATEIPWSSEETLAGQIGAEAAGLAFSLPLNVPSAVIELPDANGGAPRYLIIYVNGREVRTLTDQEYDALKLEALQAVIADGLSSEGIDITQFWRDRTPTTPLLDPKFLAPPTPTPVQPDVPVESSPVDPNEDTGDSNNE